MNKFPSTKHFLTVDDVIEKLDPSYPVFCFRPHEIKRSADEFLKNFPGRVLYAVKCNPHPVVLQSLYEAGIRHYDTASLTEIALIREHFSDVDCYFMHPVKSRSAILSAHEVYGVAHYVIDHAAELDKLLEIIGPADGKVIIVRVNTPQYDALYKLSEKFGTEEDEAINLLRKVSDAGFQTGLAFHVGSQCRTPDAYKTALEVVGRAIKKADVPIQYLDVGGGFPAHYVDDRPDPMNMFFETVAKEMGALGLRGDCVLMCEPGRGLVASGCSILTQVHLRKDNALYLNDGVYHSLSEAMTANLKMPVRPIRKTGSFSNEMIEYKIFGPTCDCTDVFPYTISLPADIDEGDWIEFGQAGAYSNAMSTRFNGFFADAFVTVDDAPLLPQDEPVETP